MIKIRTQVVKKYKIKTQNGSRHVLEILQKFFIPTHLVFMLWKTNNIKTYTQ